MSNIIVQSGDTNVQYLRYLGHQNDEAHQIRVNTGILHTDIIVYYQNNNYSFLQLSGNQEFITKEIYSKIKDGLDKLRVDVKGEAITKI